MQAQRVASVPSTEPMHARVFSLKRLLQLGSAAAALASILGLAFTIGDRALGLFASESAAGVQIEKVALEPMTFRTYLETREGRTDVTGLGYSQEDLDAQVLAVAYDARFGGWAKGATFDVGLTLQTRDRKGQVKSIDKHQMKQTLDAADDFCGCNTFFFVPRRGRYRVDLQIYRPNAPAAEPLQRKLSDWQAA